MDFPAILKKLRREKKVSQAEFAKQIGVAQSTVGGWEAGTREPSMTMLKAIADFFEVPADYLVSDSAEQTNDTDEVLCVIKLLKQLGYSIRTAPEIEEQQCAWERERLLAVAAGQPVPPQPQPDPFDPNNILMDERLGKAYRINSRQLYMIEGGIMSYARFLIEDTIKNHAIPADEEPVEGES